MPEMLLPMFLLEPFDPTQIAFGSQCGRETIGSDHRSARTPVSEPCQANLAILHGG